MLATVIEVRSPAGRATALLVRWVDGDPCRRPVLVLTGLPGEDFWWTVPAAVLHAVAAALAALSVGPDRAHDVVVLGQRPDAGGPEFTELPVSMVAGAPSVLRGRAPRELPPTEAAAAVRELRLRPVADLLRRVRAVGSPERGTGPSERSEGRATLHR